MARDNLRTFSKLDFNFLGTALVIAAVGCLLIYSATYFDDPGLGIFRKQLLWLAIGFVLMMFCLFVDYHVFSTSRRSSTASASCCCCTSWPSAA